MQSVKKRKCEEECTKKNAIKMLKIPRRRGFSREDCENVKKARRMQEKMRGKITNIVK